MLNTILETCAGTLTQGLIYAILSYGIFITYKILDFPDLTVDGSFPLGAAVTAVLLTRGVNAWLTLPVSLLIGAAAGLCTGLIHVRAKVRDLLAGIITMTALYSINLQIAGSNLTVERAVDTIYTSAPVMAVLGGVPLLYRKLLVSLVLLLRRPLFVLLNLCRRELRQTRGQTVVVELSTNGVASASLGTDATLPWRAFHHSGCTRRGLILNLQKNLFLWVPASSLPSPQDWETVRDMARTRLPRRS